MALRTVLSLIGVGGLTHTYLAANAVEADNIATDAVGKDEINETDTNDLMYTTVVAASTADIANPATGAPSTLDGVSLQVGDDVLLKNQADHHDDGIYNVDVVGTGADGQWTRAAERNAAAEYPVGMVVFVKGGANHATKLFTLEAFAGTLGTDPMTWDEYEEGLRASQSTGEPEAVGVGDGSDLRFDLSCSGVKFIAVFVDAVFQAPTTFSISAGTGAAGVDELVFEAGNAPANLAVIEALILKKS